MTCRLTIQRERMGAGLTDDQINTFLDLARQGDKVTFRELARCVGVGAERLDEFWAGMIARIWHGREGPSSEDHGDRRG